MFFNYADTHCVYPEEVLNTIKDYNQNFLIKPEIKVDYKNLQLYKDFGFRVKDVEYHLSRDLIEYEQVVLIPDNVALLNILNDLWRKRSINKLTFDEKIFYNLMDSFYLDSLQPTVKSEISAIYNSNEKGYVFDDPIPENAISMVCNHIHILPYSKLYINWFGSDLWSNQQLINTNKHLKIKRLL